MRNNSTSILAPHYLGNQKKVNLFLEMNVGGSNICTFHQRLNVHYFESRVQRLGLRLRLGFRIRLRVCDLDFRVYGLKV